MQEYWPHVLFTQQFSAEWCDSLFARASQIKEMIQLEVAGKLKTRPSLQMELMELRQLYADKLIITFFYEESTRTRISFEVAAHKWRMRVDSTPSAKFSSVSKGESLEHTVRVLAGLYPDAIVFRFNKEGMAEQAVRYSSVPIINAGDGIGQHPTQALLDLYTIERELGRNSRLTVVLGGDLLNGRTVHSLVYLLTKYPGIRFIFVSPRQLALADKIKEHLVEKEIEFFEMDSIREAFINADVVYWTRVQKERFGDDALYQQVSRQYVIGMEEMACLKPHAILMHPLPINSDNPEILPEVDSHPQAKYIIQAQNGLWVRMALLEKVVNG